MSSHWSANLSWPLIVIQSSVSAHIPTDLQSRDLFLALSWATKQLLRVLPITNQNVPCLSHTLDFRSTSAEYLKVVNVQNIKGAEITYKNTLGSRMYFFF